MFKPPLLAINRFKNNSISVVLFILCHISRCAVKGNWASTRQNLSSGFPKKRDSKQSPQLQRLAKNEKLLVPSLDMILSKKRITKVLISLSGCAGWSALFWLANTEDRVSPVEAQVSQVFQEYRAYLRFDVPNSLKLHFYHAPRLPILADINFLNPSHVLQILMRVLDLHCLYRD